MTVRMVSALIVAAALTGCGPSLGFLSKTTADAGGSATYQTVVGRRVEVNIFIRNPSRDVPHLVVSFVGSNNWLLDHDSITTESSCKVREGQFDCGTLSTNEYMNLMLRGLASRPGRFQYSLALSSVHDGHRDAINAADGRPLTLTWTEGVAAP